MVVAEKLPGRSYDIAVIGGGIIGVFCAYHARLRWPKKKIALIERDLVGKGITSYSAYLDMPYGLTDFKRMLTRRSRILFNELISRHAHLPIAMAPFIGVAAEDNLGKIISNLSEKGAQQGENSQFEQYGMKEITLPGGKGFFHGLKGSYAYGDIAYQLAMQLAKDGLTIHESTEVQSVKQVDQKYRIETNYGLTIDAGAIINATGPWLNKGFNKDNLQAKNIRLKKIVALHLDIVPAENAPIIYFFDDDAFLLPQPHFSRYLFSYRCNEWDLDIDKSKFEITSQNIEDAMQVLNKYGKRMQGRVTGGRVYCDLYSPNGDPVIEATEPDYITVGAPGGSGYRLAPAMAEAAVSKLIIPR